MGYREELSKKGITATKSGKYLCPQCSANRTNKTDKCLSVQFKNDCVVWKCHNCDFHGGIKYDNQFTPSIKKEYKKPAQPKTAKDKKYLYDYFKGRGISEDIINLYDIDINNNKEIIFPYYKDKELVNVKYRKNLDNGKKEFRQEPDSEKTFYGMDLVQDFNQVVIVEGEADVLACAEAGIEAVSVPQGASENKLECIDNCYEWLQLFDTYIIAVDNDEPGHKLKNNLLNRLDKCKCKIVDFSKIKGGSCKDANEVLQTENGKNKLQQAISTAEYIKLEGITDFITHTENVFDYYYNGYEKGYSTGWKNIDEIFTIKTGYLMIVTGIPSRGKSFFIDNMFYNLSKQHGLKHLLCSFENTIENHFARLAQMHIEKKFSPNNGMSPTEVCEAMNFINEHFLRLEINRLWTVDQILEQIEYSVRRYGINTVVIDPYNRIKHPIVDREDKYIGELLSKLSMAVKKFNLLIVFIAHPKKLGPSEQIPNMYSISGSSDWYNMADYGIIIHRERESTGEKKLESRMKVIIQKVKDFHLGEPSGGETYLDYDSTKYKLIDCEPPENNNVENPWIKATEKRKK